jgi:hypothetical protein
MNYTDYILAELRYAEIRARLIASDLEAIGLALKTGLITPDQAIGHLCECDAVRLVGTPPEARDG